METFYQQIINLLVAPPGNLVYHLVLAFSIAAGLQAALIGRKNTAQTYPGRLIFGLAMILLAQLLLFLSSGLAWQQVASPERFLPPLDRIVAAFSLVWIVWLWCFPTPSRLADAVTGVISLAVVIFGLFTISAWLAEDPALAFNGSIFDLGWELFGLAMSILGLLILLISRPAGWGTGLAMLALMLAGWVANLLLLTPNGDFSGIVRLSQLCAYPLLPSLAQRLAQPVVETPGEKRPSRADPRVISAWMQVASETDPKGLVLDITHAVAQSMLADLCFLMASPDEQDRWVLQGGYDLAAGEALPEGVLPQNSIPALSSALLHGKAIRLSPDGTSPDVETLRNTFNLDGSASMLAAPLISGGKVLGGIVLLAYRPARFWSAEEQETLVMAGEPLVQILQRPARLDIQPQDEVERLSSRLQASQAQLERLRLENKQLLDGLNNLRAGEGTGPAGDELAVLLVMQKESQQIITNLQADNERLNAALQQTASGEAARDAIQLESELHLTLEEIAHLQNGLAEANMKIMALQRKPGDTPFATQQDIITSISKQLRQPMAAIGEDADRMLAEMSSAFSARQRGYLDRMKASLENMQGMLDDLVRVSSYQDGLPPIELQPETDLADIVDEAVKASSALLQEKNLSLQVNLPDPLPALPADPQAVRQILVDLLRNAGAASMQDGTVALRISVEQDTQDPTALLLQVSDTGGGIAADDLPHVFEPRTQSGSAITGLADGGYGLAITQALVQAHGGKIWVESEPGHTSTYIVRLPLETNGNPTSPLEA